MKPHNTVSQTFFFVTAMWASCLSFSSANELDQDYSNTTDKSYEGVFDKRERDWRNGAVVYQVLVDRFAPSASLDAKKALYESPKILRSWDEVPKRGQYLEKEELWSHEIDFWGGDLHSLTNKLDYIDDLGVEVLYLNPIHLGYTNHKYDSLDYHAVSPEFGTREDVTTLANQVHKRDMKIVLDGVFNHMGRNSEVFQQASSDHNSLYRDWFYFDESYPGGHRSWANAINLPELNLENKAVRAHIYGDKNSVVQSYLSEGIDGWRLDVAYDIGFNFLEELTQAAHKRKPGSLVVGEIWNYPTEWFPSVDGVMNFTAREIIWKMVEKKIDPQLAMRMIEHMIEDVGIESMLKSWLVLDNHDTPRLIDMIPNEDRRKIAQVMQFTLPGAPNLYYGSELGMTGGEDPEMRAPMRWDWVNDNNITLAWTRKLIDMHKKNRALKIGNFRKVVSNKLVAYERYTNRVEDTVIVVINAHEKAVSESIMIANSKLMNWTLLKDQLGNISSDQIHVKSGLVHLNMPANSVAVFKPDMTIDGSYTPYKRVQ